MNHWIVHDPVGQTFRRDSADTAPLCFECGRLHVTRVARPRRTSLLRLRAGHLGTPCAASLGRAAATQPDSLTVSLSPPSLPQSKSQGQPRSKVRGNRQWAGWHRTHGWGGGLHPPRCDSKNVPLLANRCISPFVSQHACST